jgi:hypothetical protein
MSFLWRIEKKKKKKKNKTTFLFFLLLFFFFFLGLTKDSKGHQDMSNPLDEKVLDILEEGGLKNDSVKALLALFQMHSDMSSDSAKKVT